MNVVDKGPVAGQNVGVARQAQGLHLAANFLQIRIHVIEIQNLDAARVIIILMIVEERWWSCRGILGGLLFLHSFRHWRRFGNGLVHRGKGPAANLAEQLIGLRIRGPIKGLQAFVMIGWRRMGIHTFWLSSSFGIELSSLGNCSLSSNSGAQVALDSDCVFWAGKVGTSWQRLDRGGSGFHSGWVCHWCFVLFC